MADCTPKVSNHRSHRNASQTVNMISVSAYTLARWMLRTFPHSSPPCGIQQPTSLIKLANECELPFKQGSLIRTAHCIFCIHYTVHVQVSILMGWVAATRGDHNRAFYSWECDQLLQDVLVKCTCLEGLSR